MTFDELPVGAWFRLATDNPRDGKRGKKLSPRTALDVNAQRIRVPSTEALVLVLLDTPFCVVDTRTEVVVSRHETIDEATRAMLTMDPTPHRFDGSVHLAVADDRLSWRRGAK